MARGKRRQRSQLYELVERSPTKLIGIVDTAAVRAMLEGIQERLSFEGRLATTRDLLSSIAAERLALGPQATDGPIDSEAGFLESIGDHLDSCHRILNEAEVSKNVLAVRGLSAGFALAQAVHIYREEVVLGDLIAPTRGQVTGRRAGGAKRAALVKKERERGGVGLLAIVGG